MMMIGMINFTHLELFFSLYANFLQFTIYENYMENERVQRQERVKKRDFH